MSKQPDEAEVQPENPDAEPPPEPIEPDDDERENDPEQVKPTGPSVEAKLQAADKANRAYMQKIDGIFGPDENRH